MMADQGRGGFQKQVKNPLLSNASVGFPFETFQGQTLLVPVAQESPPELLDGKNSPYVLWHTWTLHVYNWIWANTNQ